LQDGQTLSTSVRLVLDYFEQVMNACKMAHQAEVEERVTALVEG
jgi:hypothetical protein